MNDDILEILAHDLIVVKEMRDEACGYFDRQEAGLILAMKKAGLKEVRYDRFVIRRKEVSPVVCWTCKAPKETPDWLPENHKPERLEISVKLENHNAA